jgi:hypothetical protein
MRVLLRRVALGLVIASCAGCAMPWQQWRTPTTASDRRVLVCNGTAAFATCKPYNAEAFRTAARTLQNHKPLTGTRISVRRRTSR